MFAVLHADIDSLKSGLLYLNGQPYCKSVDQQKSKMESKSKALGTITLIDTKLLSQLMGSWLEGMCRRDGVNEPIFCNEMQKQGPL
jgi:hypothetical protein